MHLWDHGRSAGLCKVKGSCNNKKSQYVPFIVLFYNDYNVPLKNHNICGSHGHFCVDVTVKPKAKAVFTKRLYTICHYLFTTRKEYVHYS